MDNRICIIDKIIEKREKKTILFENESCNAAILNIPPSDKLQRHYHPLTDDIWVVIKGNGKILMGDSEEDYLEAGMVINNKKGDIHGIKNTGIQPIVIVAISTPMPVDSVFIQE